MTTRTFCILKFRDYQGNYFFVRQEIVLHILAEEMQSTGVEVTTRIPCYWQNVYIFQGKSWHISL